jgi:uncharacterized membrane protein YedE/YeeE
MNEYTPWPWYVAGPIVGLMVPLMLLVGNRRWGVSSSLRHVCAIVLPAKPKYLRYDWKSEAWSLFFVAGAIIGGFIAARFFPNGEVPAVSPRTIAAISALGFESPRGLVPPEVFGIAHLWSLRAVFMVVLGGFLVGFGTRYANGCTSGHAVTGLAYLEWPSLVATLSFFAGGLFMTHVVYRLVF